MNFGKTLQAAAVCLAFLACVALRPPAAKAEAPYTVEWIRQLGTPSSDRGWGVSADGLGNVYISGWTEGSLGGPYAGAIDAFVSKYDVAGSLLWTRQLGTSGEDRSYGVSADGLGNVYISGHTWGSLGGGPNAGGADAFVSKYNSAGNLLWTQQLGTSSSDYSKGVSVDGLGHVYISGGTWGSLGGPNEGRNDAFVSKYDAAGSLLWTQQLGTSDYETAHGVSADGLGNVYISGYTEGSLGGPYAGYNDAFVSKYDAAGSLLWTQQLGTSSYDVPWGVSADGLGNVYISGDTEGILGGSNAGYADAFVAKYDAAGNLLWTQQLGTSSGDCDRGVSVDGLGNVYISGITWGSLGGPNAGLSDAFVAKYDAAGNLLWTQQLGTSSEDYSHGVSADGLGNVYISGSTYGGSLGGPNAGGFDAFLTKLTQIPLDVDVDVNPGSCPNPLNVRSRGVLPVAILGTEEFDVMTIDLASILLGREGIEDGLAPLRWAYEDVATPFEGDPGDCHDLDGDGYLDLALKFETQDLIELLGLGEGAGGLIPLILTGSQTDEGGGYAIEGTDSVWVLVPGKANRDGATPEPATLSLLALGGLALIARRRRCAAAGVF